MPTTRSSLLLGVRSGESGSWNEFVTVYRPLIEAAVRSRGLHGSDADDVIQEVLLKMLKALPRFHYSRERGHFRGWLRRIVRNAVNDHFRARRSGVSAAPLTCDVADRTDDDDIWETGFRQHLVRCALGRIRAEVRPRTWQCFEGLMLQRRCAGDVSRDVGVSENAVYINSSRVMSRVREYCVQHGEKLPHDATSLSR